ncbi:MAG TPA: tetratricopeptide repeat protein [Candidatus Sulfotelmatobacter sp.]|nr:tetratricopeptide repeat protein [Candidatus Sulfotelmatobacter sp.]
MNSDTKDSSFADLSAVRRTGRFIAQAWNSFFEMLETPQRTLSFFLGGVLLFTFVLAVYSPVLPGTFLMDDWRLIDGDNDLLHGKLTAWNIWFQTDFALSSIAFWLQRLAFGTNPFGYHLTNIILHAASAMLVWRLLLKLKIPGAWLAAALYAVHPVCVNSVARAAEIKNTLSLPFFLFSFIAYLNYERLALYPEDKNQAARPWRNTIWYLMALISFLLALFAKTSVIMLPAILLAAAWWQREKIRWKDFIHTSPFFVLSLAFGLLSIWFQKHQALASAGETLAPETFWQRITVAGHVVAFYLGKALWPSNLNLVYPQWTLDSFAFFSWLPFFLFGAALLWCWRFPDSRARHLLFALGTFAVALFPALGLFDSQFLTRWQVSDHLQYLPLIAPLALIAALLAARVEKTAMRIGSLLLILILSTLAFQRARVYSTEEKLMSDSVAKNPAASYAQNDLGVIFANRKDMARATEHFQAAVLADTNNAAAHLNLGQSLMMAGKFSGAEKEFQTTLALKSYDVGAHKNYARLLRSEGRNREAVFHYLVALRFQPDPATRLDLATLLYQDGDAREAVDQFQQVLLAKPDQVEALNNLAWLLATCGDGTVRNGSNAVVYAERACELTGYRQAKITGTLAAAYAEASRFPEAVSTGKLTVKLANESGDQSVTYVGNELLKLYANGQSYHEPVAAGR